MRLKLEEIQWSADDKEPGQILFVFDQSELMATASVRFYLHEGFQAPEISEESEVDFHSQDYQNMIRRSLMHMGDTGRVRQAIGRAQSGEEVTIAYIGGSITQGAGAVPINSECYA